MNLILGNNGGGKSSVLRALAIAVLAPALLVSGFVPYRLVRRTGEDEDPVERSFLKVVGQPSDEELSRIGTSRAELELIARIDRSSRGSLDRLHLESTPDSPITELLYDDYSSAFFVAGYGATRRVEAGEYSPSSALRSRGLRYQRIASLFEDHVALRPMQSWLSQTLTDKGGSDRFEEVIHLINAVLPDNISFDGRLDREEDQYVFACDGVPTPFTSLSDGYKAFIGWSGDLIGQLVDIAEPDVPLNQVPGIVLVDEIDLHLHPEWQRTVIPSLASAFPAIQFVFTSHSPLVASTVRHENVFVTDAAEDGSATIKQIEERVYGRSAEQLLLSSYFGLQSTRPADFESSAQELFQSAASGNPKAALDYLEKLTASTSSREG